MNLVAPDILAEASGLPLPIAGTALAIGLILWLFGARSHRFWIALVITVTAGLIGLAHGQAADMQPLVAGLLLAVAAGALALSLVRVLLFIAGGFAALAVMQALAPNHDEPIVSFLVGGLGGILLYRLWITVFTSFIGTLLIAYSSLCLLKRLNIMGDVVGWSQRNGALLNWGCAAMASMGVLIQFLLERRRKRKAAMADDDEEEERYPPRARAKPKTTWFGLFQKRPARRAG
jgi:hypothetical protein